MKKRTAKTAKKKVAKNSHGRAQGKTQISISLDLRTVKRIDEMGAFERRNRSNMIVTAMNEYYEDWKRTHLSK